VINWHLLLVLEIETIHSSFLWVTSTIAFDHFVQVEHALSRYTCLHQIYAFQIVLKTLGI